ncbi:MAG: IS4 family transposase [Saccharospirillaceae bacterium]|nr:IS4 family transposase [Saccharospirillaceae bacterium]
MHSEEFLQSHRKNSTDFTRNRTLTFPRLVSFMLNAINGSIQNELNRFFQVIDDSPVSLVNVSTAAFCKARKKLSYRAFKALNETLIDTFYQSKQVKRWHGLRLLAVDGSVTTLPKNKVLLEYFGKARSHSVQPAVRISQLYDVKNKLTVDLRVEPHTTGERNMALKHLEYAQKGDVIVYDRGYPAVWFFKYHLAKGVEFCTRATLDSSNIIKTFLASGNMSETIAFPCTEKSLRRCRKDGLSTESIDLRLVRVDLPTGTTEILITSLVDETKFPTSIFADLYCQRWDVEEDYKVMKSRLSIENFSGVSVEAVLQDIHAKTLTKNLASIAIIEARKAKPSSRKYKYRINVTHALSQLKDNIVRFLMGVSIGGLSRLMIDKISQVTHAYRPNRKFERPHCRMSKVKYPMAYKRLC